MPCLDIVSFFAERELKRIKARVAGAHKHLRKTDRWAGRQPPYGWVDRVSRRADQEHRRLTRRAAAGRLSVRTETGI